MKVWVLTRRHNDGGRTEGVFGSEAAAQARVDDVVSNELIRIQAEWERIDDRLVWTARTEDAFGRPALVEFWISPYEVRGLPGVDGVEVLEPPPGGAWTYEWTCKAKGCGARLRARAEQVRYSYHEDCESPYSVDCPFCGTWDYVKNAPPHVHSKARRQ